MGNQDEALKAAHIYFVRNARGPGCILCPLELLFEIGFGFITFVDNAELESFLSGLDLQSSQPKNPR